MKTKSILYLAFSLFWFVGSSAQHLGKKDIIGKYKNQSRNGDTTSSYLFLSNDSFKIIYGVDVNDGKDFYSPMIQGTWIVNDGVAELISVDGHRKKAMFKNTSITIEGKNDSIPILIMEGRTYIDIMKKVRPPIKSL